VLASDNDNPAAPNTGRALLRRFCFELCLAWGIVTSFPPPADALQVGRFSEQQPPSLHQDNNVGAKPFVQTAVTTSQVRLAALKQSMEAKGRAKVRDAVRRRMGESAKKQFDLIPTEIDLD
jgi:hypothetical protein